MSLVALWESCSTRRVSHSIYGGEPVVTLDDSLCTATTRSSSHA